MSHEATRGSLVCTATDCWLVQLSTALQIVACAIQHWRSLRRLTRSKGRTSLSKLDLVNRIPHGGRIEDIVHRVPRVTAKPVGAEKKTRFLRLEAGHPLPCLAHVLRYKDAVLPDDHHLVPVASKERTLPDADRRSLLLPTRAFILADEKAIRAP